MLQNDGGSHTCFKTKQGILGYRLSMDDCTADMAAGSRNAL